MSEVKEYDAIVIGAGQGGGPLAGKMALAGWKVAVVERAHAGGTCVNTGCTPTKTMAASARVAYLADRSEDYGVRIGGTSLDQTVVRKRKRDIVEMFRNGSRKGLESKEGLDLIMGEGRFVGEKQVEVKLNDGGTRSLTAETVVIDTGTRPRIPDDIKGIDSTPYLDNASIMELGETPEHLIIVGGGYIGLEFGQMFRRFGSDVTIIEKGPRLMPREDADVCGAVQEIFEEDGIELHVGCKPTKVAGREGEISVTITGEDQGKVLDGSHVLLAAGRVPNTDALNPEATGLATDERGYIPVNDRLETGVDGIYALGDVIGGPAFTHVSYDHYRVLRANLLEGGDASKAGRPVPYTVYIDPQLARVGLSEDQAKDKGIDYEVATMPMTSVARALEVDETRGMMKAVVDPESKRILGCAILGIEGGEIMSMIQIAMMGNLPYTELAEGVFAHPTLAESLNTLFGKVGA